MAVDLSEFDEELVPRANCGLCRITQQLDKDRAAALDAALRLRNANGAWQYPSVAILRRLQKWGFPASESVMSKHRNNHL